MEPTWESASLPLYVRVGEYLRAAIGREFGPGELLPPQHEIARRTGTSLITVKRAVDELAREGLLEPARGRGTVVKRPAVTDHHRGVSSWTDNMAGLGLSPRTAWTKISTRVPPRETKALLGLKARAKTVLVERLRTVEGEPFCLMDNEIPLALVPDLPRRGMTAESIYRVLDKDFGLRPARADEEVGARHATIGEKTLLGRDTNIIIEVRRVTCLADGTPMEIASLRAPARRYRYRAQLLGERSGR